MPNGHARFTTATTLSEARLAAAPAERYQQVDEDEEHCQRDRHCSLDDDGHKCVLVQIAGPIDVAGVSM
jgi:hypothetical protein